MLCNGVAAQIESDVAANAVELLKLIPMNFLFASIWHPAAVK